jgi:hypothetical protein
MLIAIVILLSLIGCYFALGLAALATRSLFISDELGPEDFACWPFVLIADGVVLLLSYIRKNLLRSASSIKGCGSHIPRRIE